MIDAKFALDEDLAGVEEAIDADDPQRLLGYGRKLRARAEDLAKRDYAKVADRGRAIVLLSVPVEGANRRFGSCRASRSRSSPSGAASTS